MNEQDMHNQLKSLKTQDTTLTHHKAKLRNALLTAHAAQSSRQSNISNIIEQTSLLRRFKMQFNKLSLAHPVLVGVIALAVSGTAGAAALQWFNTDVTVNESNDTITAKVENCPSVPPSHAKAVGMKVVPNYSYSAEYKINDPDAISKSTIETAIRAECEQRAIAQNIDNTFPDMTEFSATKLEPNSKGLYFPIYSEGTVRGFNGTSVTLQTAFHPDQRPDETITIQLASDALITKAGEKIFDLKAGDRVYFSYQNKAVDGISSSTDRNKTLDHATQLGSDSVIRGIGVLTIDDNAIAELKGALSSGRVTAVRDDPSKG